MNLLITIEFQVLIGLLCAIAWYVCKRQRIGSERDAAAMELMKQQGDMQLVTMRQMSRMNEIGIERARREAAEHKEGEGWKES